MKLFITIPDFSLHGGIRVIIEWANRLTQWHEVYLHNLKGQERPAWIAIDPRVTLCGDSMAGMDALIITSPHSIHFAQRPDRPAKVFLFLQMLEHLFRPHDKAWNDACHAMYSLPYPMFSISQWNMQYLEPLRQAPMHYIGNGVNLDDFPIDTTGKEERTVLVEGWEAGNPTKDIRHLGPAVAQILRRKGIRILAYGAADIRTNRWVPHEYVKRPSLAVMNQMYRQASVLIKASLCDARSCSPMEAMTKGTVTARAINDGDDDLVHRVNCLRSRYELAPLQQNAEKLLADGELRQNLANTCLGYVQQLSWDYWMHQINHIISQ